MKFNYSQRKGTSRAWKMVSQTFILISFKRQTQAWDFYSKRTSQEIAEHGLKHHSQMRKGDQIRSAHYCVETGLDELLGTNRLETPK